METESPVKISIPSRPLNVKALVDMLSSRLAYQQRVMGALIAVLILLTALVRWWPAGSGEDERPFRDGASDRIQVREIQPTNQAQEKQPPPPAPLPPVVVPNDVLITDEVDVGEIALRVDDPGDDEIRQKGQDQATAAQAPDTDARLLKNVQPNYPSAARDDGIRARIEIEVTISDEGQVREATVQQRWRLSDDSPPRAVAELGYGLEEAALTAARRSLFRPAQAEGRAVETRKVITFTFGE